LEIGDNKMSFLSTLGKDFKAVFSFLGSPTGKAVIGAAEGAVEVAVPATTAAFNLINNWMAEALKVESIAAAAGQQDGTGAQKAAMAISTMTPQILQFAASQGYPVPNSTQITAINTAVVNLLNLINPNEAAATTTPVFAPKLYTPASTINPAIVDGGVAVGN